MSVISAQFSSNACTSSKCHKLILRKDNEQQKEKALLQQKIEFLEDELSEYRQREQDNRKINESIMVTYQQSEHMREETAVKSIRTLKERHEEEIQRLKQFNHRESQRMDQQLLEARDKYEQKLIEVDRMAVEHDKKVLEVRKSMESQMKEVFEEKERRYEAKIELLTEKVQQNENLGELYREFLQKRRNAVDCEETEGNQHFLAALRSEPQEPNGHSEQIARSRSRRFLAQNTKENNSRGVSIDQNYLYVQNSRKSVKELTSKINRALVQLRESDSDRNSKLHQKINARLKAY